MPGHLQLEHMFAGERSRRQEAQDDDRQIEPVDGEPIEPRPESPGGTALEMGADDGVGLRAADTHDPPRRNAGRR